MVSYTFNRDTIVKNIFNDSTNYNIRIFNDFDVIEFCILVGISCIVVCLTNIKYQITTPRISELEKLFPEFSYFKVEQDHKQIIEMIMATNNRIDKLVSHFETIMVALGQRKASEEPLDI